MFHTEEPIFHCESLMTDTEAPEVFWKCIQQVWAVYTTCSRANQVTLSCSYLATIGKQQRLCHNVKFAVFAQKEADHVFVSVVCLWLRHVYIVIQNIFQLGLKTVPSTYEKCIELSKSNTKRLHIVLIQRLSERNSVPTERHKSPFLVQDLTTATAL